jgi:hypothetical protein
MGQRILAANFRCKRDEKKRNDFRLKISDLRVRVKSTDERFAIQKTKRPGLKESWDARPNSPPPSAAQGGM